MLCLVLSIFSSREKVMERNWIQLLQSESISSYLFSVLVAAVSFCVLPMSLKYSTFISSLHSRFVALTPWRVYHLTSLIILVLLILQIMRDLVFSKIKGKCTDRVPCLNTCSLEHARSCQYYDYCRSIS